MRGTSIAFAAVVAALGSSGPVRAAAPLPPLVVATHDEPPSQIHNADGSWSGISIDLLRLVAGELGTTIVVRDTPREQIVGGPLPDADVVATLAVGERMNSRYELSHAFQSSGLAIAVPEVPRESTFDILARIFSGTFLWVLIGTVVLLGAVGLLMWWIERRPVPPAPPEKQALSKALFWAFEPVIGYKASQHSTRAGRILGTLWGVCGVVLVSGLTASLASQLTAHRLAPSVRGPDDLPRVRVAIVDHTRGVRYCDRRGIRRRAFRTLEAALAALEHGEVDAVVDDAPDLSYAQQNSHPHIHVLPGTFMNAGAAFGLRPDSPLRHDFNRALLKVTASDAWRSVVASYLGQAE